MNPRVADLAVDVRVATLATRQHGMVSTAQLRGLGMSKDGILQRVRRGRLHPYCRGVYVVGHTALTREARLWVAVLACGGPSAAVVSHRSAAAVWDLVAAPGGPVDVTTLRQSKSTRAIRVHRSRTLRPADITDHDGLPLTTPTRTLIDLADVLSPQRLERVVHRAEILRLLDAAAVQRQLDAPGRRSATIRAALETLGVGTQVTRSVLEERMLRLVAHHRLPRPLVNFVVEGHEVDFFWSAARLCVETDGAGTHLTPTAFELDRERDAQLTLAGYRVVRFTWRQLRDRPQTVAATIRGLLEPA